jgi:hypothetical protein
VGTGTGFILGRRIDCLHRLKGVPPVECPSRAMPGMLELSTAKYATDSDLENVSNSRAEHDPRYELFGNW